MKKYLATLVIAVVLCFGLNAVSFLLIFINFYSIALYIFYISHFCFFPHLILFYSFYLTQTEPLYYLLCWFAFNV